MISGVSAIGPLLLQPLPLQYSQTSMYCGAAGLALQSDRAASDSALAARRRADRGPGSWRVNQPWIGLLATSDDLAMPPA
jgi:hypothetical protein